MRKLSYLNNNEKINVLESKYWSNFFYKNLKIGVEIEFNAGGENEAEDLMSDLRDYLEETYDVTKFGKTGFLEVKEDGSLPEGLEVVTVGRRIDFNSMFLQYKYLVDYLDLNSCYVNSRCGLHNHILLDYNGKMSSLEKNVPDIIVKNFAQLIKRHLPEICWITSTVSDCVKERHLEMLGEEIASQCDGFFTTRSNYFCSEETLYRNTVQDKSVKEYGEIVSGQSRYKAVNFNPMGYDDNGEINRLHLELRFPDGSLFPAQIAAQNVLYGALFLKAIKLSEFGLISTGEGWERTKELMNEIRNEFTWSGDCRYSSPLKLEHIDTYRERGMDMLMFLSQEIKAFDNKAYNVLCFLNDTPISILNREKSYEDINKELESIIKYSYRGKDDEDILKLIAVMDITQAMSEYDWCVKASKQLSKETKYVVDKVREMKVNRELQFDKILGTLVEVR